MNNKMIVLVGFLGMTGVALGAFGAHGLKMLLEPDQMETFRTGVFYHFVHTLAILSIVLSKPSSKTSFYSTIFFFTFGIVLFSGSLYLLSCRDILGIGHWRFLGPLTPVGGLFFIAGWMSVMFLKAGHKAGENN